MNSTIETILNHRSIRSFEEKPLEKETIHTLIEAAQQASTSSYMMAYSIIGITDRKKKEQLHEVSGHPHVLNNGHLFIICADYHRMTYGVSEEAKEDMKANLENSEHLMTAAIDGALAAQNLAIAAESMGLGMCYLGSLRNDISKVDEILNLPEYVSPLFGIAVGVPAENPEKKPRLPQKAVYFENEYQDHEEVIRAFNDKISDYYASRSSNRRTDTWSDQMLRRFRKPIRMDVTEYLHKKGFNKR
ncbi:oxygen-insensitive NADPH nitroreductase [Salimicrobium halophilum]|uniref:FMN reductase (NADPH) n=1 Tax=Salimicrobium halophilum TaxID=86666 RepID=A0A1G8RLZ8_9BACI|nr:oxygen-insensitive NADPH nitroreductase [Salimicrobium halophilum]SDJ17991.1 FMN reductase (NADPH) [Salimicrobium halophilum]